MKNLRLSIRYIAFFLVTIVIIAAIVLRKRYPNAIGSLFTPVSVVSKVATGARLESTDGRTNVLILGIDKRSPNNGAVISVLTDTIIVVSIDDSGQKPVIISIPRDLWLEETRSKVNAIYSVTKSKYSGNPDGGIGEAIDLTIGAVEHVVGIPIHYYVVVGFDVFVDSIDAVGGIEVTVDETFDDYKYPVEGKENVLPESERYEHVHFGKGKQSMDGETALKYARSRYSTNPKEAGDFARARRQQKVLIALKDAILSPSTLLDLAKMKNLYETYQSHVKTNVSFAEALLFYDKYKNVEIRDIRRIVLSNEPFGDSMLGTGTLIAPSEEERGERYNGQYVLIPADRTFDYIHGLVRATLFE